MTRWYALRSLSTLVVIGLSLSCAEGAPPRSAADPGPYTPAHTTLIYGATSPEGALTVEVWYPSETLALPGAPIAEFEASDASRETLESLLASAPAGCPRLRTGAVRDAPAAAELGARPLVVFSHCLNCGRYASFSLAERLASHGFIVVSPDHAGALPFAPDRAGESLDEEQLGVRVQALQRLITASLDGSLFALSPAVEGLTVNPERIGAMGHSFGSATTGRLAQIDDRVRAAVGLAAPMASFVFPETDLEQITAPLLMVLAQEDNSITEVGNDLIRANVEAARSPVWLLEVEDAGHWSVSDLCGLVPDFMAGCGEGVRHSRGREGERFTYLSVTRGIDVTRRYATAFFLAKLQADTSALSLLNAAGDEQGLSLRQP